MNEVVPVFAFVKCFEKINVDLKVLICCTKTCWTAFLWLRWCFRQLFSRQLCNVLNRFIKIYNNKYSLIKRKDVQPYWKKFRHAPSLFKRPLKKSLARLFLKTFFLKILNIIFVLAMFLSTHFNIHETAKDEINLILVWKNFCNKLSNYMSINSKLVICSNWF